MVRTPDNASGRGTGRHAFWRTVPVLLQFKVLLGLALLGAVISAVCFGSGLIMVLPVMKLLLEQSLSEWIRQATAGGSFAGLGDWLVQRVPDSRFAAFGMVAIAVALLTIVASIGRYVHELLTVTVIQRVAMVWRGRLFRRLIHASLAQVMQSSNSDHMSRIVTDTRVLSRGYRAVLGKAMPKILSALVALIWAFWLDWFLTLIALISAPLIVVLLRKFGTVIRRASKRALRMRGRMLAALGESLRSIRVVKVHNAEGYERRRFRRINRSLYGEEMKMRQVKAMTSPLVETLGIWGVLAVSTIAAWYIFQREHDPARFMTVLMMLVAAAACLKPLAGLNNSLHEASAAATRMLALLQVTVEPTGPDADPHVPALARHQQHIVFDAVSFTYPGQDRPALWNVCLEVQHGRMIAIVGGNGSGKTTLLSLMPRLLGPSRGRVLIDGVNIATVSLRSLRGQIAMVTQDTVLFEGTVAGNIAYGRGYATLEQIVAVAQAAHAHDFITDLPHGYQTSLGEDGSGLSGGQRQRLCIARAILRDPAILILDEATSQIDADSEAQIGAALGEIREGRTIFVIAHRLSTVIDADRIVVMDRGRIVDEGKHGDLLVRCDIYRTLTHTQLHPVAG